MGRRGPQKTPLKLAKLRGNPGRRPLNNNEPVGILGVPAAPSHLTPAGKATYNRLVKVAMPGLLQSTDHEMLAAYADSCAMFVHACRKIVELGPVDTNEKSSVSRRSGWATIRRDSLQDMKGLASHFGFTPSSRTAIQVTKEDGFDTDNVEFLKLVDGTN